MSSDPPTTIVYFIATIPHSDNFIVYSLDRTFTVLILGLWKPEMSLPKDWKPGFEWGKEVGTVTTTAKQGCETKTGYGDNIHGLEG
jgi:hypothetical protein